MLPAGPQDLAAKHVADSAGNLLIEQGLGDGRIEIGVAAQRLDRGAEVGVTAHRGPAPATEPGMAMGVELAVGLDGASAEAHRGERVDRDADTQLRHRLTPPFAGAIEVPGAAEKQVGVQDQAVVPDDVELLATALDELDHAPDAGRGAVERGAPSNDSTALPTRAVRNAAAVR